MDWNTLLIATIPAILTALISYFSAAKKGKVDLEKIRSEQETALKTLEINQRLSLETIEKNAEKEIEKIRIATQKEIELYTAKSKADMKSEENKAILEHAAPIAASLFEQVLNGDIDRATETFGNLEKFTQKSRKKT